MADEDDWDFDDLDSEQDADAVAHQPILALDQPSNSSIPFFADDDEEWDIDDSTESQIRPLHHRQGIVIWPLHYLMYGYTHRLCGCRYRIK